MSDVMQADVSHPHRAPAEGSAGMSEIISTAPQESTACRQCGGTAEFGYRADGEMRWYCAAHRLAGSYADARLAAPVNNGTEVEASVPHQWSLDRAALDFEDFSATSYALGDKEPDSATLNGPPAGWRLHVFNAADLRRMKFKEVPFVVVGVIIEGLTILAGRPKIGKSWLALDVCLGVAQGRGVLGNLATTQGDVLYAALEDNPRRLQKRIAKLLSPYTAEWPARLTLATSWRRLDAGGVDDIADWAADSSNPRLVVLDTLAGVRPPKQNGEALYDSDYRALVELHRLAAERGFAVLVLHHTRKAEADDPLDTVSGTLGLVGCADTALVLARSPGGTTLYVRGRDLEEHEDAIVFDRERCTWTIQGEASEVRQSDTRKAIFAALTKSDEPLSPKDVADLIGLHHDNVRQTLRRMTSDGEIFLASRGKYSRLPPPVTTVTSSQEVKNEGMSDT